MAKVGTPPWGASIYRLWEKTTLISEKPYLVSPNHFFNEGCP